MLALGLANLVGAVLFAAIYAAAGARYLSQGGFVGCLVLIFGLATVLWVRTESRHAGLGFVRRLGRAAVALVAVLVAVPIVALLPLFWLESALPPETGIAEVVAPAMALVLIALVLVTAMNVVGGLVQGGCALARRPAAPSPDGP